MAASDHLGLARLESGQDQRVTLAAVNAISAMVAPVVLLTVGGLISNGLIAVYTSVNDRLRQMTRERIEILTGPGVKSSTWPPCQR